MLANTRLSSLRSVVASWVQSKQLSKAFSTIDDPFRAQRTYKKPRTFIKVETLYMKNSPGQLAQLLAHLADCGVNLTSIESKLNTFTHQTPLFHIDVEGNPEDKNIIKAVDRLREAGAKAEIMAPPEVPWFPINIRDLDLTRETLDAEVDLIAEDHPGFHDKKYRARRAELTTIAQISSWCTYPIH
jgi:phenylalanine-4-hydroxylase